MSTGENGAEILARDRRERTEVAAAAAAAAARPKISEEMNGNDRPAKLHRDNYLLTALYLASHRGARRRRRRKESRLSSLALDERQNTLLVFVQSEAVGER